MKSSCLSSETIEVRYVLMENAGSDEDARLSAQLPTDERIHADRYLDVSDRLAFSTARVLLRRMLSLYADEPASGWRFAKNDHGKPAILRTEQMPDLHFNISHCAGMVAVAVSLGHPVGVDVESALDANLDHLALAHAYFSAAENHLLESHPAAHQRDLFYALWTLKEAYLKADGRGLYEGISEFSFALNPPTISFSPESSERTDDWFFLQDKPTSSHRMAIAARRREPEETLTCRIIEVAFADLI